MRRKKIIAKPRIDLKPGVQFILIYAGTFAAFRVKEFAAMEDLVRFVARNRIQRDEFAVVQGTIVSVTAAYRDKKTAIFTDAGTDELTDQALEP